MCVKTVPCSFLCLVQVSTSVSVLRDTLAAHLRWRTNSTSRANWSLSVWWKRAATTWRRHLSPDIKCLMVSGETFVCPSFVCSRLLILQPLLGECVSDGCFSLLMAWFLLLFVIIVSHWRQKQCDKVLACIYVCLFVLLAKYLVENWKDFYKKIKKSTTSTLTAQKHKYMNGYNSNFIEILCN